MDSINNNNYYYRKTSPIITIKLWKLFDKYSNLSQIDFNNLLTYELIRIDSISIDIKTIVENLTFDKLIVTKTIGQQIRISAQTDRSVFGELTNDWFCFECHNSSEESLIDCKTCFRSYHKNCLQNQNITEEYKCVYCEKIGSIDRSLRINRIEKRELNQILLSILKNFETSIENFDVYKEYSIGDNHRSKLLIFNYLDLNTIKVKVINNSYESITEFENDFKHFIHNYMVYKVIGLHPMLENYINDHLIAVKQCIDCFNHIFIDKSIVNIKKNDWFARVCDPPHVLVYVKLRSEPHWPAKVVNISSDDKYTVQYFDQYFSRSVVTKDKIRPIDSHIKSNELKSSQLKQWLNLLSVHLFNLIKSGFDSDHKYMNLIQRLIHLEVIDKNCFNFDKSPTLIANKVGKALKPDARHVISHKIKPYESHASQPDVERPTENDSKYGNVVDPEIAPNLSPQIGPIVKPRILNIYKKVNRNFENSSKSHNSGQNLKSRNSSDFKAGLDVSHKVKHNVIRIVKPKLVKMENNFNKTFSNSYESHVLQTFNRSQTISDTNAEQFMNLNIDPKVDPVVRPGINKNLNKTFGNSGESHVLQTLNRSQTISHTNAEHVLSLNIDPKMDPVVRPGINKNLNKTFGNSGEIHDSLKSDPNPIHTQTSNAINSIDSEKTQQNEILSNDRTISENINSSDFEMSEVCEKQVEEIEEESDESRRLKVYLKSDKHSDEHKLEFCTGILNFIMNHKNSQM